ncbi:DUF1642 domain-containing protein [Streptococcus suis]|uniref:DUF1642 domain-containing protein n=1 Tax=Streptococcus suis TaxID=1307 RepID=UPI001F06697C|nr:DUF1642 domain-containing protein [Streptococcus suis]MCH1645063.1 DUF1642 domain-containing protein [Streptococcus suis]
MNKQEAIEEVTELFGDSIQAKAFRNIIRKLHEPQKVVVQKFVAEWYERNKDDLNTAIYSTITGTYRKVNGENDDLLDTFEGWLVYEDNSILILVQMHLFGYEVEQEQMYTVEIPNPHSDSLTVLEKFDDGTVFISQMDVFSIDWRNHTEHQLTESEIKQDFEWAWQFAVPVEEG